MMRRIGQIGQIGLIGLIGLIGFIAVANADITFPVAELGGCRNEVECKLYCDKPENISACVDFAEQNGLMDKEEASRARAFVAAGSRGPGGCTGQDSCEAYCEDTSHLNECLAFAEEHELMDPDELGEAKKVAAALAAGAALPGGCKTKSECDAYCQAPGNIEECLLFAEKAGFLSGKELEEARRVAPLIARGETPGGCTRKEQCEAYCSDEANMNECAEFAIKAGFMSAADAEMYRKTGGKGPGNCRSKESCEAFCNDSANQETCFKFAEEHGLLSEEDRTRMREGMEQMRGGLEMAPGEVRRCLEGRLGGEVIRKIESGDFMPSREMGDAMGGCFEEFMPKPEDFMELNGGESFPGEGFPPPEEREGVEHDIRERIEAETRARIENQIEGQIREQIEGRMREQMPPYEELYEERMPMKEMEEYMPPMEQFEPRIEYAPPTEASEPAPWSPPGDSTEPTSVLENSLFGFVIRALLGR